MHFPMVPRAPSSFFSKKFEPEGLPPRARVLDGQLGGGGVGSLPPLTFAEWGDGSGHRGCESEGWRR